MVADFLEEVSDHEVALLLRGDLRLSLVSPESKSAAKRAGTRSVAPTALAQEDVDAVLRDLATVETREGAISKLVGNARLASKDGLLQIARALDVHVNKHDKRETIEDKIAESVVGVRLRSQAIHGVNLKSGASKPEKP